MGLFLFLSVVYKLVSISIQEIEISSNIIIRLPVICAIRLRINIFGGRKISD